jgi:cytochrome b subunit of formate dehydrogenase
MIKYAVFSPSVTAVKTTLHFTSYNLRSEEDCAILPVVGTLSVVEYVDPFADERSPEIHFECDGFRIYVGDSHLWLRECFATLDSERTLFMRHPYTGLLMEIAKVPQFDSPTDALVKMEKLLHDLTAKPTILSTPKENAL